MAAKIKKISEALQIISTNIVINRPISEPNTAPKIEPINKDKAPIPPFDKAVELFKAPTIPTTNKIVAIFLEVIDKLYPIKLCS